MGVSKRFRIMETNRRYRGAIYEADEAARTQSSVVRFTIRSEKTERLN
jgi:hypothetical protein